ncbi:MAG: glycosyltransferase family 4 protein [Chloroflexota bacterium]
MRRLKILTWHVHGSYLFNLIQAPHDFYLPTRPGRPEGYGGRSGHFPWPENVHDVPFDQVNDLSVDLVLYQSTKNYLVDRFAVLGPAQRERPAIYLEHNTPKYHPTDARHPVDDPAVLLVHCTHFNALMWDNGRSPTVVVPHGVVIPPNLAWTGELARGITAVNGIQRRGRLAGFDVFLWARDRVPLDLVGMGSEALNGLGDVPHHELLRLETTYRFFFNPIRYTSMPLSVIEAMAVGLPIAALATTELPSAVPHREAGFITNDLDELVSGMEQLARDRDLAGRLGKRAREIARETFGIQRFIRDWERAFRRALGEE